MGLFESVRFACLLRQAGRAGYPATGSCRGAVAPRALPLHGGGWGRLVLLPQGSVGGGGSSNGGGGNWCSCHRVLQGAVFVPDRFYL